MAQALADKAAAERERKASIRRVKERLAALDPETQAKVQQDAAGLGTLDGGKKASWRYLEQSLDGHAALDLSGLVTAETKVDLDDPASVVAGVDKIATDLMAGLTEKVRQERVDGLTIAEIAQRNNLQAALVRELLGDELAANGAAKAVKAAASASARKRREPREVRGDDSTREEKCPVCGEWHDARMTDGKYDKTADFREGRADCRACYNRRWREGVERRKSAH